MIFAAGLGTRLRPLTDTMPKAMVPVGGRPLIDILLAKLYAARVERVVVNVHHFADMLEEHLSQCHFEGMELLVSDERSELLDTGGGLRKAAPLFDPSSPILIHNVDILSNADLSKLYELAVDDALLLVSKRTSSRQLTFNTDTHRLEGWINLNTGQTKGVVKAEAEQMAFSGIHLFHPRLFPAMDAFPSKFSIVDFYLNACQEHNICGFFDSSLQLLDVGKQATLDEAASFLGENG